MTVIAVEGRQRESLLQWFDVGNEKFQFVSEYIFLCVQIEFFHNKMLISAKGAVYFFNEGQ
jgi:hypothetical protein